MVKGSNRKMFRKPGMARRAIGILASSPELMQAANRNMPVRLGNGGDPLFEQARQQARYMLSRPNVSYGMNEDQMTQSIYQNLLSQKQGAGMNRAEQLKATAQDFSSRIPVDVSQLGAFSLDTSPFARNAAGLPTRTPKDVSDMTMPELYELRRELGGIGYFRNPTEKKGVDESRQRVADAIASGRETSELFTEVENMVDSDVLMEQVLQDRVARLDEEMKDKFEKNFDGSPSAVERRREKNREVTREKLKSGTLEGLTEKLEELRQKEADVLAAGKSRGKRGRLNSIKNIISKTESEIEELQNKPEDEEETLSAVEKRRRSRLSPEERDTQPEEEIIASGPAGDGKGDGKGDGSAGGGLLDEFSQLLGDGMNIGLGDGSAVKAAKEALADMGEPPELAEQPDFWSYLTRAGLAIAAGKSDDPLANIAEGVLMTLNTKAKEDKEFRDTNFMRYLKTREQKAKDLDLLLTAENVDSLRTTRVIDSVSKLKAAEAQAGVLRKDEQRIMSLQDQGYGIFSADIAGAGGSEIILRQKAQASIAQDMVKANPSLIDGQPFKPTADSDFFVATSKNKDGTGPITIRKAKPDEKITIQQVS